MKRKTPVLLACLIAISVLTFARVATMQSSGPSLVRVLDFNPAGADNLAGFNFEVAVLHSTGLVYSGSTGAFGPEVTVIDPAADAVVKVVMTPTVGPLNFARANQTTGLVYFRQGSNVVVVDGRPASPTFNQALPSLTLPGRAIQSFALNEAAHRLYVTSTAAGTGKVTAYDLDPASPTFHQVVGDVSFPAGTFGLGLDAHTQTGRVYVAANGTSGGIYVLNGAALTPIPGTPHAAGVIVNEAANMVYATVARNTNLNLPSRLAAIDATTDAFVKNVELPKLITPAGYDERLAVNAQTGRVYVRSNDAAQPGAVMVVGGVLADRSNLASFGALLATIEVGRAGGAVDIYVDESLNRVVTTGFNDKFTYVIDGATNQVMARVPTTQTSSDVTYNPVTRRAFVANQLATVQEINVGVAAASLPADGILPAEATVVTAAEAGSGVVNPSNHLYYVPRTLATTDVLALDAAGDQSAITNQPAHGAGRYIYTARNAATGRVYAVNSGSDTTGTHAFAGFVSVIDGATNSVIANVATGAQPFAVPAVNEVTNKVYVPSLGVTGVGHSHITVIDGATNTATNADTSALSISDGRFFFTQIAVNPATGRVYCQMSDGSVATVNGATNIAALLPNAPRQIETAPGTMVNGFVNLIRVNKTLNRVYFIISASGSSYLRVLDGANDAVLATLALGPSFGDIAVNEKTGRVFVTKPAADALAVIDGHTNTLLNPTLAVGDNPSALAVNEFANRVYVGNANDKSISFVDGLALTVDDTLAGLPFRPGHLAADHTTARLYVSSTIDPARAGVAVVADPEGSTPAPTPTPVTDGLVSWWRADGSTADHFGVNNGTFEGGASYDAGHAGQAFRFDGATSYVRVPNSPSLNPGAQMSLDFWMKADAGNQMNGCCQGMVASDFYLVEASGGSDPRVGLNFVTHTGGGFAHTSDGNGGGYVVEPRDGWHHVAATYDGATMKLYVDGQLRHQRAQSGAIRPMRPDDFLSIGSEVGRTNFCPGCGPRYFKGLIDEVRFYGRALSASEVQTNFSADPPPARQEQTITFDPPADMTYGDGPLALSASASSGLAVGFEVVSGPATLSGNVLTVTGAGLVKVRATQPGDAAYNAAPAVERTLAVAKATPAISWDAPAAIVVGTPLGATQLNASASFKDAPLAGTFAYMPAAGVMLPVGDHQLRVDFTPADAVNFNPASLTVAQRVNYGVCPLYDQTKAHKSGSTVPVKLRLCDAAGANLTSPNAVVRAVGVRLVSTAVWGAAEDAGSANPDSDFRFDGDAYHYNLKTTGLQTGTYHLGFVVVGDPTIYTLQFQVR